MSTFRIDDEHGNELCAGLPEWAVRGVAQRKANDRRAPVYVSEDVEDGDEAEEIEPESLTLPPTAHARGGEPLRGHRAMTTTIACFSGGKDSTAMLLLMMERGERIDGLLVTPTGNELPEVWGHWSRMAALVGAPVVRPKGPTLADLITAHDALPNHRQRWCTRQIKIEPAIAWSKANPGATLCVGLRADEEARSGIISTSVPSRFPLREAGWGICDVQAAIARHGITVPKRTDCAVCYEQRIGEWYELWRDHPEQWAQGEAWEAATGRTFRSPHPSIPGRSGRDTWPAAMRDMAARFAVEPPARGLKLLQRDREGQACRVCSL